MIVAARYDERDGASVLRAIRIRMQAFVQLRRDGERERPKKCSRDESGNEITEMRFRAVSHLRVSFSPPGVLRKNISVRSAKAGGTPAATLQFVNVS